MLWLYVLPLTVGVVLIVPTVLRAVDDLPGDVLTGSIAFLGFFGGLAGLFTRQVGGTGLITLIVAITIGLAAAAVHPEFLAKLRGPSTPSNSPLEH